MSAFKQGSLQQLQLQINQNPVQSITQMRVKLRQQALINLNCEQFIFDRNCKSAKPQRE